jgi:UDP-N-acetylmuramoylalanine--D-glutamate ligase
MDLATLLTYKDKNVHVVGLSSVEGAAVTRFLLNLGFSRITTHDFSPESEFERQFMLVHVGLPRQERKTFFDWLAQQPVRKQFGAQYLEGLEGADLIFATQAWFIYPINFPKLAQAKAAGIPFTSITELYFDLAPCPIAAVTGAHGKSTTTRMIYEILSAGLDRKVYLAGNERHSAPVLDQIEGMQPEDLLLLEISNRQLRGLQRSPQLAVVTNVYPNHLDEHDSYDDYIATKRSILEHQRQGDTAILNRDNPVTRTFESARRGRLLWFSTHPLGGLDGAGVEEGIVYFQEGENRVTLGPAGELPLSGAHNLENALAAAAAGCTLGVSADRIWEALRNFRGIKHRLQLVRSINGVRFIDDLNSTTPSAALAAIHAISGPVHLIVGGDDKGLDYSGLAQAILERARTLILLPGQGPQKIQAEVEKLTPQRAGDGPDLPLVQSFTGLEEAVEFAYRRAGPGETVLLSPACPYFYRMFYLDDSGDEEGFRTVVRNLALREAAKDG